MSNPQQQMFDQYQKNMEFLKNIHENMKRTDISEEEKDRLKKQEQALIAMINNFNSQILQQRIIPQQLVNNQQQMNSPSSTNDNMGVNSTPGSPAFNQQQQQQFLAQEQLRAAQQQQQQAAMSKMGQQMNNSNTVSPQQQQTFSSLPMGSPVAGGIQQGKSNAPTPTATSNMSTPIMAANMTPNFPATSPATTTGAAQAAVAAAAAAAVKNNGMFAFPTNQVPVPSTPTVPTTPGGASVPGSVATNNSLVPGPAPLKPATASSLDNDGVNRVLTKRKIQELVSQIDPAERLEPEVEEILLEIADEFIESVTTFACQLAKHRKSDTLEVKDVQLHLERNWNIRIPGFAADDIRPLRKPTIPSSHQTKVQAVNAAKSQISNSSSKKDNTSSSN